MVLSFTWTGSNAGAWSDSANWTDITSSPTPAAAAPGIADTAVLTGSPGQWLAVSGPGQADRLTLAGQVELDGSFTVGTLAQSGTLAMLAGSLVASGGATVTGAVEQTGGAMMVDGLAINGGTLTVAPGAFVEVGADGAADGSYALVIDAGATLSLDAGGLAVDSVLNLGSLLATGSTGTLPSGLNFGLISGLSVDALANYGVVASGTGQSITVGGLTGFGEVDISPGGTVDITQGVTGSVVFQGDTGALVIEAAGLAGDALAVLGFSGNDVISLGNAVLSADFTPNGWGDGTLTATTDAGSVAFDIQGNYDSSQTVTSVQGGVAQLGQALAAPCFATGTRIMTRHGEVPVEALRPGDEVATLLPRGFRTVRWIGHRSLRLDGHPRPADVQPICIRAGAFGQGRPHRDLFLSPDHALFAEGMLVPVKYLVNGDTVARHTVATVTYWHVELDRHDVLLAEGLAAESYLDTGDRAGFANGGAVVTLHPGFGALTWEAAGCAPLVVTGPVVERVRARLRMPVIPPAPPGRRPRPVAGALPRAAGVRQ